MSARQHSEEEGEVNERSTMKQGKDEEKRILLPFRY
jgi:hypothetical protein